MGQWATIVLTAYFGGRSIEKVARILSRKKIASGLAFVVMAAKLSAEIAERIVWTFSKRFHPGILVGLFCRRQCLKRLFARLLNAQRVRLRPATWQLIRLGVKAAGSDTAARVAETNYGAAVNIVLAELERMVAELRVGICRYFAGELAINEMTQRALTELRQYLDNGTQFTA